MADFINYWNTWASIINNTLSSIVFIVSIIWWIIYFWGKKYKILELKSSNFNVNSDANDFKKAMFPISGYEEIETIEYNSEFDYVNFIKHILPKLQEIKEKYQYLAIFWISEMFLPFCVGFFMQNTKHIIWYRKLKEQSVDFMWNPWAYPGIFSLKWGLWITKYFAYWLKKLGNWEEFFHLWDEINLIIPISFTINEDDIPENLKENKIYKFWLKEPNWSFLINKRQLKKFENDINTIISKINTEIWNCWKIHIFATLPIPFCIALWQAIHRNNCECIFYDLNKSTSKYSKIISTREILNLQNLWNMKKN